MRFAYRLRGARAMTVHMPRYCFTNNEGRTVERYFRIAETPRHITINGVRYKRDFAAEMPGIGHSVSGAPSRIPPKWDPHFKNHTSEGWCVPTSKSEIQSYARDRGLETTS